MLRDTLTFMRENAPWLSAGMVLTLMSSFGQTFFISVFAGEIRSEFQLSHGAWGSIYAGGTMMSAIVMVWAGMLTDHFRARTLGIATLLGLAFACVFMATNTLVWLLPVAIFLLRLTGQGMASHIAIVAMARWFVATRGRALAIATFGFSVGETLLPILFVALLAFYDWRLLWLICGGLSLLAIPVLFRLLRTERIPGGEDQTDLRHGMSGRSWTRTEMLRHPLFWSMIPALLGPSAFNTAFFFHQVHFAEIKGMSHLSLVSLFPVYTLIAVAAMIGSGLALDRFGTARLMPWYQLPLVIGFLVFGLGQHPAAVWLGFVCMALTTGANSTLPNAFWAEFYGTRHIGAIKSLAAAIMVLGSALGPAITGNLIDLGLDLDTQYIGVAVFFLFATLAMVIGIRRARPEISGYA